MTELSSAGARALSVGRDRLELAALLAVATVLYVWDLGASGYANDFYAAAVQAGTQSWKAMFFGSFDSSNFITVDKPPLSLWPMELSGRIFGFNSISMLVPNAIEGVLAVWLLYAAVRRSFGHRPALLAGGLFALTPVAVLMFRFNNPDAAMVLLVVTAAYCVVRALEAASTRWVLLAGLVMGLSFLAKGLQPFTVLPALGIAYLVAAPTTWRRRGLQLLGAAVAIVVGAGWWVLAVGLTPAADRPYIGGSGDNSPLGLAFGYNGIGRLDGNEAGRGGGFSGATGLGRMFNDLNGGQIAWLLPAALLALVALAVLTARAPLADSTRAHTILWGGWLVVTAAVLSFASGTIHTYYTVELAPAIAALVAIGAAVLWRRRADQRARAVLAVGLIGTGVWTFALLDRASSFDPWVRWAVLGTTFVAALAVLAPSARLRRMGVVTAVAAGATLVGGSVAYAVETVRTPHTGSTPSAGPATDDGFGFGGGGFGRGGVPGSGFGGRDRRDGAARAGFGDVGFAGRGFPGGFGSMRSGATASRGFAGRADGATVDSELKALLDKTHTTWAAATIGSMSAAPLELATGKAVMAIGGFSGTDAAPTLAQFEKDVSEGRISYFVADARGGFGGAVGPAGGGTGGASAGGAPTGQGAPAGSDGGTDPGAGGTAAGAPGGGRGSLGGRRGTGEQIQQWVEQHFSATTVGGTTVYDLTRTTS